MSDQQSPPRIVKRVHMNRYIVFVDQQGKSSFDSLEAAENEAKRILAAYPKLAVRVADSESDTVTRLGPTKAPDEPEEEG